MRIGLGYDVHRLESGRRLIIGGVDIPYEKGLLGHSDADVLVHAIIDSLLGACSMGDIGRNFPDKEAEYKDIDSLVLLKRTAVMLRQKKYEIKNIDSTVVAQAPKLSPYIDKMRENIANAIEIDIDNISVKAKTEEGLGFTGNSSGISAQAVCLVEKNKL